MELSRTDLVKYPFLEATQQYIKTQGPVILVGDVFSNPDGYESLVDKAVVRLRKALFVYASKKEEGVVEDLKGSAGEDKDTILSFPVATILAKASDDHYLQSRYALGEAKRAYFYLKSESAEKLFMVAKNFDWKIAPLETQDPPTLNLHFVDFLRNASSIHEVRWKLINQHLVGGMVVVPKRMVARLLQAEIQRYIDKKLISQQIPNLPEPLSRKVGEIEAQLKELGVGRTNEPLPGLTPEAFPPCIAHLRSNLVGGRNLPHMGRFTLTAFLLTVGMGVEEVVKLYTSATDFDEGMTRYQVEHIGGLRRGGRNPYRPLNCASMKTHGLCINADDLCPRIRSPLGYYRRKTRYTTPLKPQP